MRQHKSLFAQLIVIFSIIFTSLGTPYNVQSEQIEINTPETTQVAPIISEPVVETAVINASTTPAYEVVQNADPYLMSLALGNEETVSRYGPNRNDPDEGIPDHAYFPFDDLDKREVCPPGGCDYVAGKVLIKFEADQEFSLTRSNEIQLQDQVLASALDTLEITNLSPVFPNAERPAPGEMIETVDVALIEKPDLTRWFQADSLSDKGLGDVIQELQTTAGVAYAEPDFLRKPIGEMTDEINSISQSTSPSTLALPGSGTDPLYDQQWHLGATHVPEAWAYLESQGLPPGGSRDIVVAVIDTGVDYTHPDLAANIWVNPAEFNGTPGVDDDGNGYVDDIHGADTVYPDGDPMDDHGHGTHVAGIIAAQANNEIGGVGVAYNVQVMPIKAAQYSGVLASSDIAEAVYYAVAKGVDVINMSFGGYARSTVEEDALAVAFGQAVLVAAAGNDGKANLPCPLGVNMYPAAYNWVLGVMASNQSDSLASFSNLDCTPHDTHEYEVMAPGVEIWSTLPGNHYAAWSGTSMSAPIISGIAALSRTNWPDKDVYSSRFIMGQIASNTSQDVGGVANALNALTIPPQPELSYLEHWLFDNPEINPINDNDGIVDAGETVDLAIIIRNHWGKADNVAVTLEAWAEGAESPDPYVTMIDGTVNYGSVGSFNSDDNGLIYDEEDLIVGVDNPFSFSTNPETPNDHIIPFKLKITATNGYETEDSTVYTTESRFYLLVQRGIELPYIISEDMTLTKDYYWLVSDSSLIAEGATVTVTAGTQLQFFSGDPEDPYSQAAKPYLQVEGILNVQGTFEEPVELFTGLQWQRYPIQIHQMDNGKTTIQYAKIANPALGGRTNIYTGNTTGKPLYSIEHSIFHQVDPICINYYHTANFIWESCQGLPIVEANYIMKSIFMDLGYHIYIIPFSNSSLISNLIENSSVLLLSPSTENVFLKNYKKSPYGSTVWASRATVGEINDSPINEFRYNAILNFWLDPDINHWMRFYMDVGRDNVRHIENNYWGTTSTTLIDAAIHDFYNDVNLGIFQYEPILTTAPETAYPFVVDVVLSTPTNPDASEVGAEPVTFTVTFNRDMDQTIQPQVSFGPDMPMTDYTVHPIDGGWTDPRTWVGTFNVNPITGDGYQLIRVAGAVAADDPWLVTGDDAGRFRFEVITSGTEAMNLQATGGEGYVDLMWTQTDFELLSGFNLYRSTSLDGEFTRINSSIIPPETRDYQDTDVAPGQPYYYKFTVVKSDMTESDFSNTATATPLDTIPPVLTHTPVTSAEPGQPLTLSATATDNVNVANVTLYYRHVGDATYTNTPMVNTTGDSYYATIEGSLLSSPGIEYYIEASDGISITRNGRAEDPNLVSVIDRPVVTIVTPNSGPSEGGTAVTISGSNFKDGATVTFGGMAASNVVFVSSSQITCTTPAHIPETVDVRVTNPDAQYGLLLNGFTFLSTAAQVSMPNTGGGTGNIVTVPINAANINGMLAASLTVNFDPAVLSVQFASTGTLTAGWAFASNLLAPGQYRLSMSSTSGVSGSGTLANIEFEVIGAPGSSSALTISNILLNDGAITVELTDGLFSVDDVYNVSGLVSYWNGGAPVPGTTLTLTGDQVYSALSGADGSYTIQGAAIDAYTLTPSKSDGDNEISAYDASFALQHDVGIITLSGNQAIAADVNSNGVINSMDAAYILQKSADLISVPFPGSGVVWKFNPSNREIADLTGNITGQDFTAVLLGDISGNWTDPGEPAQATVEETRAASAVITIPDATVLPDGTADIPISLDITDAELLGADIVFTYDPTHIAVSDVRLGTLAAGWSHASNLSEPGVVKIAMAGAMPITTSGELVLFTVTALGASGTQSALTFTQGELNEGAIPSTLNAGSVYIAVPPIADFSAVPTSGIAPLSVSFTNLSTGDWTSSSWDFGDGATSTEENPSHSFATAGIYTVSLTVTGSGGSDTETKTDYIQVSTLSVSGQVLYWNESKAIPNAQISMTGDNPYSDTTDSAGSFSISGILSGSYTLTPANNDDFNGITAYDAAMVLRHIAELDELVDEPAIAADVDENGTISPLDASYILQKSVGLINEFSTESSMWQFDPQNYTYTNLTENQSNQDFTALLLGDVTGNWTAPIIPTGMNDLPYQRQTTASLTVESKTVLAGANFDIVIDLTNMGEEILAGDIILTYDPEVIKISNVSSGSLVSDWPIAFNLETPGIIRIAIADTMPVNESGEFIILSATAIDSPDDETEIGFTLGSLNEGAVPTELLPGLITIDNGEVPPNKIYLPLIVK